MIFYHKQILSTNFVLILWNLIKKVYKISFKFLIIPNQHINHHHLYECYTKWPKNKIEFVGIQYEVIC